MTLCIAAKAYDIDDTTGRPERVVLAFDSKVEAGYFSAETELKLENLSSQWCALLAGNDLSHARRLVASFRVLLAGVESTISIDNAADTLNTAADIVRREIAERLTQREFALSLDDFYDRGETALGPSERDRVLYEIRAQRLGAELLLIGYFPTQRTFGIFHYSGFDHRVVSVSHFGVIGSGGIIANANLYQRELRGTDSLREALYVVYESQKLGQNAPGVGRHMTLLVLEPPVTVGESVVWRLVSNAAEYALQTARAKYGPKEVGPVELPPDNGEGNLYEITLTEDATKPMYGNPGRPVPD